MKSAFVLLATHLVLVEGWEKPWFCHGLDCPEFTQIKNMTIEGQVVEFRRYTAGQQWASTREQGVDLNKAESGGFNKLFNYIGGENAAKTKIPMTSPVRDYVQPGQGPYCATNFTVSFYVPYANQPAITPGCPAAPKPTESDVYIATDREALQVAVLPFPGQAPQATVLEMAAKLSSLLAQTNLQYDKENWFYSAYDPPFRVTDRHQEIWIQIYSLY